MHAFGTISRSKLKRPQLLQVLAIYAVCVLIAVLARSAHSAPTAPTGLTGVLDGDMVTLEWSAMEGVRGYNVYVNDQYQTTTLTNRYEGSVLEGQVYSYYIVAFAGTPTEFSSRSRQLTLPEPELPQDLTIPPSTPDGLSGTIEGNRVSIRWQPSTDDEAVRGYNVYQNNRYLTTVFDVEYNGTVVPDRTHTFSIAAFDIRSNFSSRSAGLTLPESGQVDVATPPTTPEDLTGKILVDVTEASVLLNWQPSTDDKAVAGYNVYENDVYKTTVVSPSYQADVAIDNTYTYYIVAFDFDGNFAQRTPSFLVEDIVDVADDTQAPSTPENLVGTWLPNEEEATIELSWNASIDNVDIAGYNIYENSQYLTTVPGNSFITTVSADAIYAYYVVAFDVARNFSAKSMRVILPDEGNFAPTFDGLSDQLAFAGEIIEIVIRPVDLDDNVPGLFIGSLPTGMRSVDNFDGTRSLLWQPLQPDVGTYNIHVTAIDAADPQLQTGRSFNLTIELPEDIGSIPNFGPGIDRIEEHIVRIGDTVVMEVKATDRNGTVPALDIINPPIDSTFETQEENLNIKVLRWTTSSADAGVNELRFSAVDADDSSLTASSTVRINVVNPAQFQRSGMRLRDLALARGVQFGFASLLRYYNRPDSDLYQTIASEEFNLLTPENSMKWGYINPEPGRFRFDAADAEAAFAARHDMDLHGHTLVWYTALPQWVQRSPIDERESIMNQFIDTLTTRYDTVAIWDVVNEAFEDDGRYRNSVWFEAMGKDYIAKAFRRARMGAPNAALIYNDYDIAYGEAKTESTYTLMQELIADNVPVDGIGFQMHIGADFIDFDEIALNFQRFADLGLDVYVTEMDVSLRDGTTEQDQATVYAQVLSICLAQPACKAFQVWGVTDRYSWLKQFSPLLFDREYQPKPAYTAVQEILGQ